MLDPRLQALHKKMQEYHAKDELLKMADVLKEAISISVDVYGINHDETLMLYTEYGGVLRNLGRWTRLTHSPIAMPISVSMILWYAY